MQSRLSNDTKLKRAKVSHLAWRAEGYPVRAHGVRGFRNSVDVEITSEDLGMLGAGDRPRYECELDEYTKPHFAGPAVLQATPDSRGRGGMRDRKAPLHLLPSDSGPRNVSEKAGFRLF